MMREQLRTYRKLTSACVSCIVEYESELKKEEKNPYNLIINGWLKVGKSG
jgi:hypothetical protein